MRDHVVLNFSGSQRAREKWTDSRSTVKIEPKDFLMDCTWSVRGLEQLEMIPRLLAYE